MRVFIVQRILAVIAHVEHDDIVMLRERQPERRIGVDGKTVAVAENDAGRAGLAVAAQPDLRAVPQDERRHRERRRHYERLMQVHAKAETIGSGCLGHIL